MKLAPTYSTGIESHNLPVLNFFRARKKVKKVTQGECLSCSGTLQASQGRVRLPAKPVDAARASDLYLRCPETLPRLLPASFCSNRTDPNDFDGARPGLYF